MQWVFDLPTYHLIIQSTSGPFSPLSNACIKTRNSTRNQIALPLLLCADVLPIFKEFDSLSSSVPDVRISILFRCSLLARCGQRTAVCWFLRAFIHLEYNSLRRMRFLQR